MTASQLWSRIEPLLGRVEKPSRYIGGELGAVVKESCDLRVALCYPDLYEIGISNVGLRILYGMLNRDERIACERVYVPERDFEELLRSEDLPLYTLETKTPVRECDVLGITLQYELIFTNVLKVLDLANIALRSKDRAVDDPIIFAGGPAAYNPEPMADFIDAFYIGDAEEGFFAALNLIREWKDGGRSGGRQEILRKLSLLPGIYVPSLYVEQRDSQGRYAGLTPLEGAPEKVEKQTLPSLAGGRSEMHSIVPFAEAVHDRAVVEIFRGCTRGCRFCQAGVIYRPVRERPLAEVLSQAADQLRFTGHSELSLASLCTTDYSEIKNLLTEINKEYKEQLNISLPSLRVDNFSVELALLAGASRKGGLTLAPEAGSQRMRDSINKGIGEEDILSSAKAAFEAGWQRIKLYFMIGLPGETEEDVEAIADISARILEVGREVFGKNASRINLIINVSTLVPKSHTPFQWAPQLSPDEVLARQEILRSRLKSRQTQLRWHDVRLSELEGIFARGDRRLGELLLAAYSKGCDFDAWNNRIDWESWEEAIAETIGDPAAYTNGREIGAPLPWDHIDSGVDQEYLIEEYRHAVEGVYTPDCRWDSCGVCGVCQNLGVDNELLGGGAD